MIQLISKKQYKIKWHNLMLLLFSLILYTHSVTAQTSWSILFEDNFEDGNIDGWRPGSGWKVYEDESYVLRGQGSETQAFPASDVWKNYSVSFRFKLIKGGFKFLFRNMRVGPDMSVSFDRKYAVQLDGQMFEFWKDQNSIEMGEFSFDLEVWQQGTVICKNDSIKFYLNNAPVFDYQDKDDPHIYGRLGFELGGDSTVVHIDDIVVYGEKIAPEGSWIKTGGPSGGLGYDIRIFPENKNIMFVTDDPSGVNKSVDGGETWFQSNTGISGRKGYTSDDIPIFSLSIDPEDPTIMWAGMKDLRGIYRTTNVGETWELLVNGISEGDNLSVRGFGIHPQNSNIVFAGAEINLGRSKLAFDRTRGKIYQTKDAGQNWKTVWEGGNLVRFVIFDYLNPNIIYASTGIFDREADDTDSLGVGVLKSTDSGDTWFPINNGIFNLFVGYLEMHPVDPNILYAAAGNNTFMSFRSNQPDAPGAVYRTTDGGNHWEKILDKDVFSMVVISPSNPDVVYAGSGAAVYRSDDGGDNWQKFYSQGDSNNEATIWGPPGIRAGVPIGGVVDPDDPMTIFINNYQGGNFKSTDGGKTWENASKGYTGAQTYDMAIDKDHPSRVYWIGRSGPFYSPNGGQDWYGMAHHPAISAEWHKIVLNPDNPDEIIMTEQGGKMFMSRNRGASWETIFQKQALGFTAVVYAPSNTDIIYAGLTQENPKSSDYGIYKSVNHGLNWNQVNAGVGYGFQNIHEILVSPHHPDTVYVATEDDGVYMSTDGGNSWIQRSSGLGSSFVRALAIDPSNSRILYAGLGEGAGLYKTTNSGAQWNSINDGIILHCPSYLSSIGKSRGFSMQPPPITINSVSKYVSIPWTIISSIVIDPKDPNIIFVADIYSGVYYSNNCGASWSLFNQGLGNRTVQDLEISSDGKIIYAGTLGQGVFRLVLSNTPPEVLSTVPISDEEISMIQGDSLEFVVNAFDLNGNVLSYQWLLDNNKIESDQVISCMIKTDHIELGQHQLVCQISDSDTTIESIWIIKIISPTSVSSHNTDLPKLFSVSEAYPNPFNNEVFIQYHLPYQAFVKIEVYDVSGKLVNTCFSGDQNPGLHYSKWNGTSEHGKTVSTGTYFFNVKIYNGKYHESKIQKMILVK